MEILIESTDELVHVDGVPCRVWEGTTLQSLVPVKVLVHRLAVPEGFGPAFEREAGGEVIAMPPPAVDPGL